MTDPAMTLQGDIVERLRHLSKLLGTGHFDIPQHLSEAATEIEALRAERVDKADAWDAIAEKNARIAQLEAALAPFAAWKGDSTSLQDADEVWAVTFHSKEKAPLKVGDFRNAINAIRARTNQGVEK